MISRVCAESEADRLSLLQDMLMSASGLNLARSLFEDWCDIVLRKGSERCGGFRIRQLGVGSMDGDACYGKEKKEQQKLSSLLHSSLEALHLRRVGDTLRWDVPPTDRSAVLAKADDLPEHKVGNAVRWRARACFAAADFVEAAGICSNATVSLRRELILQGKGLDNGLRPILQRLNPQAVTTGADVPVPFLWLVPSLQFLDCSAGPMTVSGASQKKPTVEAEVAEWEAKQAAAQVARALGPRVVQYAVEIPDPKDFGKLG